MILIAKGSFDRDTDKIRNKNLRIALFEKLKQLEQAKDISHTTGLKLMRGYSTHYRIHVNSGKLRYRIGAVIRSDKIWLVRFLTKKNIYKEFP